MKIKPVRTHEEYEQTLGRISDIMDCDKGTPEWDELDVLTILVEAYENFQYPIDFPDPISAIHYHLDRLGLRVRELVPCMGSFSMVVAVLDRREPLTLEMIRRLRNKLDISADILIQRYDLVY